MARLSAFVRNNAVTHLGFSLMTRNFRAFEEVVRYLRHDGWQGCIIAGGVHATVRPQECLCEGVDYVVAGPGGPPLVDLLSGRAPETISGLVYRQGDRILRNPVLDSAYVDLQHLPFPDYDFQDHYLVRGKMTVPLETGLYRKLLP
jgi:radical SAM superfamily enzyme YgiQ (UPF0313 family)